MVMALVQSDLSVPHTATQSGEIRMEAEFCIGERVKARTMVRVTPIALISTGVMVAAIILAAAKVRAAR
jgi:hypothetical protein